MEGEVLVLNSDYEPLNVCNIRRAVVLVFMGKAEVLHEDSKLIRLSGTTMASPSVVKLRHRIRRPLPELKLSRRSIFARDSYICQYCGQSARDLTIDHVVPKRLGGCLAWENLVCSCKKCNSKKGDKTLQQAGMSLIKPPRRPRYVPYISLTKYVSGSKNETWQMYLPSFEDR